MRNLVLLRHAVARSPTSSLLAFAVDGPSERGFVLTETAAVHVVELNTGKTFDASSVLTPPLTVPLTFTFLPDLSAISVVLTTGTIALIHTGGDDAFRLSAVELVGAIDGGATAARWAPDMEILGLITVERKLLLMTKEWDVLYEQPIPDSVPTAERNSVSWRGDGQLLATNVVSTPHPVVHVVAKPAAAEQPAVKKDDRPARAPRILHVWERNGVLRSTADRPGAPPPLAPGRRAPPRPPAPPELLAEHVAWRPAGPLFAVAAALEGELWVQFYEPNGLRHGEFQIRAKAAHFSVAAIEFNADSEILAVLLQPAEANDAWMIQLWTVSNMHWFLKQEIRMVSPVVSMAWDVERASRLYVAQRDGALAACDFSYEYSVSLGDSPSNQATVTVIDGPTDGLGTICILPFKSVSRYLVNCDFNTDGRTVHLRISHLRQAVVPPPMSQHSLTFSLPVTAVTVSPSGVLAALLSNNTLVLVRPTFSAVGVTSESPFSPLPCDSPLPLLRQLTWYGAALLALTSSPTHDAVVMLSPTSGAALLPAPQLIKLPQRALRLHIAAYHPNTPALILLEDNSVWQLKVEPALHLSEFLVASKALRLPVPCHTIAYAVIANQPTIVAHSERGKMFANTVLVCSDCSSFTCDESFLTYTSLRHHMRFMRLAAPLGAADEAGVLAAGPDETRAIERGGRLVVVMPAIFSVVLQMPRGNLETIFPRALALAETRRMLDSLRWHDAFILMRKHRIDLNLMYDHAPSALLSHASDFVNALSDPEHINLFLSSLTDDDVTTTLFPPPQLPPQPKRTVLGKVNLVCDAIRVVLQQIGQQRYLLSILTAYARRKPADLEAALRAVKALLPAAANNAPMSAADTLLKPADHALKYLVFLVDVNELFDVALGLYDFELTKLVAQKSQKDPKEFLPFLAELQALPQLLQRYRIDMHLNRNLKALYSIAQAGDEHFETLVEHVKKHKLHAAAVAVFAEMALKEDAKLQRLLMQYGDYLVDNGRGDEAGYAFMRGGDDKKAQAAFLNVGNWHMVFVTAGRQGTQGEELRALALAVLDKLSNIADFQGAGAVAERYLNDVPLAVKQLLKATQWEAAVQLIYQHGRVDLLAVAQTAVTEAADAQIALLGTQNAEFLRMTNRLGLVRQQRALQRQLMAGRTDTSDDSSEAGSEASFSSAKSSARSSAGLSSAGSTSSRKREKKQRAPRISGKEGGPREEEYLCTTLKSSVPSASLLTETAGLLRALAMFGQLTRAKALQTAQDAFIDTVNASAELLAIPPTPHANVEPQALPPPPPLVPAQDWHLWWSPTPK